MPSDRRSATGETWHTHPRSAVAALLVALGLFALSGVEAMAQGEAPSGAAGGEKVFQQLCAACHGIGAKGDGPVANSLTTKPADLTAIAARRGGTFPDQEISEYIDGRVYTAAHGPREMPVWGRNLGTQVPDRGDREKRVYDSIEMLVAYLKSIQGS